MYIFLVKSLSVIVVTLGFLSGLIALPVTFNKLGSLFKISHNCLKNTKNIDLVCCLRYEFGKLLKSVNKNVIRWIWHDLDEF